MQPSKLKMSLLYWYCERWHYFREQNWISHMVPALTHRDLRCFTSQSGRGLMGNNAVVWDSLWNVLTWWPAANSSSRNAGSWRNVSIESVVTLNRCTFSVSLVSLIDGDPRELRVWDGVSWCHEYLFFLWLMTICSFNQNLAKDTHPAYFF